MAVQQSLSPERSSLQRPSPARLESLLGGSWFQLWVELEDGLCINDDAGRYLYVNPAYCQMLGYGEQELVGRRFYELVPPRLVGHYKAHYASEATRSRSGQRGEFLLRHKEGRIVRLDVSHTLLRAGAQRLHLFVNRDVTLLRDQEQAGLHADRLRALGTLAAGMAHEYNNLLVSILGYAELIGGLRPERKVRVFADKIRRAARRGSEITSQLLPFADQADLQRESVDLHRVVRDAVDRFRHARALVPNIELELGASRSEVFGSASQLIQVMLCLLLNAAEATEADAPVTVASVVRPGQGREQPAQIELRVSDCGRGMSEAVRRRAFEPFFTTKPAGEGTGLGLSLVVATVVGHQGTVVLDSQEGAGTCVQVRLPLLAD